MAEYVGDDLLATQIRVYKEHADAIAFLMDNLIGGLDNAGHGYAQEYATWHAEELLDNLANRAQELADSLHSLKRYTRTGIHA